MRDEVPNIYIQFDEIDGEDGIAGTGESPAPWRDPPTSNLTLDIREPWKARASTSGPGEPRPDSSMLVDVMQDA